MRQVTATEKYRAVNEGKMAKKEFVRQMRQSFPQFVSQYNGFDDTVQILKNKGMLFEAAKPAFSGVKVYDDRPTLTYSLDTLDRGIRAELAAMGVTMPHHGVKPEDYLKAEKKAKDNLEKDANHYLNLMSGESNKVDKHDREKEVKRGALDKDTFNGLKKATLKEATVREDEEEDARNDADYEAGWADDPRKDEGMSEDAKKNLLGKVIGALRTKYPEITAGILKDFIKTHYQDLLDGADIEDEFIEYISVNYEGPSDMREKYDREDGDGHTGTNTDDDFEREMQQQLVQREAKGKDHDGDIDEQAKETTFEPKEIKSVSFPNGLSVTVGEPHPEEEGIVSFIRKGQNGYVIAFTDGSEGGSYAVDFNGEFLDIDDYIEEKKGKDHDGDGDIDSDDYMAAKDKAIKKAMGKEKQLKEAIKYIIKKTLNEDILNEAATNQLARIADDYAGFEGMKSAILDLQNIVTDIEGYYDKTRGKIQKVYDRLGEIRNEEGLKVGGFLAPAIESAFNKDLRPVEKTGFTKGLNTPKIRTVSRAEIDAARERGEIDETPEVPKSTVFTPNF